MVNSPLDYANLIRASGLRNPIPSLLRCLIDNGAQWAALLTPSGKPIELASSSEVEIVSPEELQSALESVDSPSTRATTGRSALGTQILAFPIGAEGRSTSILILAVSQDDQPEMHRFGASTAQLLRLLLRDTRRLQTASRMVRDSITRLIFASRIDSAFELAAEMGLSAPPSRPHVVCIHGVRGWDNDDLLDLVESAMDNNSRQILAYSDDDECWLLLSPTQFKVAAPEFIGLVDRHPSLKVLLTEQIPAAKISHRWQHWSNSIRNAQPGSVVDRSGYHGESPSDWVHKLQRDASSPVVAAVVEYLRCRGRWEAAAENLELHRNTLRYRVSSAEKILGLDLTDPTMSARLWLALRSEGLAD